MKKSNPPEADDDSAKDPHLAEWQSEGKIEYEIDQTAGVLIVESEVLEQIYALLARKRFRMGIPDDAPDWAWRCKVSLAVGRVLNDYHMGDFRDTNCLALGSLIVDELMEDIRESMTWLSNVYFEDAVGFSVISGTTKVMVHFSQEDLDNGGITS